MRSPKVFKQAYASVSEAPAGTRLKIRVEKNCWHSSFPYASREEAESNVRTRAVAAAALRLRATCAALTLVFPARR